MLTNYVVSEILDNKVHLTNMSTNKSPKHDLFDADSIKIDIKPIAYRFWTRRSMKGTGSLTQITMNKSQTNLNDCDEDVFPPTQMRSRGWTFSTTATHATHKDKIHHDRHVTRTSVCLIFVQLNKII